MGILGGMRVLVWGCVWLWLWLWLWTWVWVRPWPWVYISHFHTTQVVHTVVSRNIISTSLFPIKFFNLLTFSHMWYLPTILHSSIMHFSAYWIVFCDEQFLWFVNAKYLLVWSLVFSCIVVTVIEVLQYQNGGRRCTRSITDIKPWKHGLNRRYQNTLTHTILRQAKQTDEMHRIGVEEEGVSYICFPNAPKMHSLIHQIFKC